MHPEVRVRERQAAGIREQGRGRRRRVWNDDEERRIMDDGWVFGLGRGYAQRMAAFLPGKTLKQIREKVRVMRDELLLPDAAPGDAEDPDSEVGSPPRSPSHSGDVEEENADRVSTASPASLVEEGEV